MPVTVPNLQTRNFSLAEVIHRVDDIDRPEIIEIGKVALGYLQGLRDYLWEKMGKEIRLEVTSGYRSKKYNSTLPGAAKDSFHIWRYASDGTVIFAMDLKSPDLDCYALYAALKDHVRGETYIHTAQKFVHVAPCGPDEEWTK